MEEGGDRTMTRRKRTRGSPPPRDITPPGLKRPPPPREEGDPYDELLDYDSDTYEYRWGWERPTRRYKLSDFVDGGTWSPPTADEARREHELTMAQRRCGSTAAPGSSGSAAAPRIACPPSIVSRPRLLKELMSPLVPHNN